MKVCPDCQRSYPTAFAVCPQDGARLTEPLEWSEGSVVRGKYRILGKIGEGGMGAVYKALHMHFNELCALKVMAPRLTSDKALVKRFEREAIFARKLHHRNAVRVEDFDETEDGRPFIVMEFIEGESLKNLMESEGPLPVPRVCSIIKQAAAALDAAHRLGLVHRDIKPDNIVLVASHEGELAKVLDFGIAKIRGGLSTTSGMSLTETGMIIGTPPYMSPEQAKGAAGDELDGRSDLYSLGIVMYQMLTGELPLRADTPINMLFAQIQTPPTPIYDARPGLKIPAPIAALVMKCLEKERERRPQSGKAIIEELERWEKGPEAIPPCTMESSRTKSSSERAAVPEAPARDSRKVPPANSGFEPSDVIALSSHENPARDEPVRRPASPVPAASHRAVLKTSRESDASANAAAQTDSLPASRHWFILLGVVLVLGVSGGAWYFFHYVPPTGQRNTTKQGNESLPSTGQPLVAQPNPPQGSQASDEAQGSQYPPAPRAPSAAPSGQAQPNRTLLPSSRTSPPLTDAEKAARSRKVSAARALGDLYYENAEYGNAIKEYMLGLDVDPSNKVLRERVARARKAKAAAQGARH